MTYRLIKTKKDIRKVFSKLSRSYDTYKKMVKHLALIEGNKDIMFSEILSYKEELRKHLTCHFEYLYWFYDLQGKLKAIMQDEPKCFAKAI